MVNIKDLSTRRDLEQKLSSNSTQVYNNENILELLDQITGSSKKVKSEKEKKIILAFLEYLRSKGEVKEKELKMNLYLQFLDKPSDFPIDDFLKDKEYTENEIWEIGKSGLEILEKQTNLVKTPQKSDDRVYKWNK